MSPVQGDLQGMLAAFPSDSDDYHGPRCWGACLGARRGRCSELRNVLWHHHRAGGLISVDANSFTTPVRLHLHGSPAVNWIQGRSTRSHAAYARAAPAPLDSREFPISNF